MTKGVYVRSEEHKKKISESLKGRIFSKQTLTKMKKSAIKTGLKLRKEHPTYWGIHKWIQYHLPMTECLWCGSKNKLERANISHNYRRDLNDWMVLCRRCHCKYDKDTWGLANSLKRKGYV